MKTKDIIFALRSCGSIRGCSNECKYGHRSFARCRCDLVNDAAARLEEIERELAFLKNKISFKDMFMRSFPKADMDELCVSHIFPWVNTDICAYKSCEECWNRPYFEEEGEE